MHTPAHKAADAMDWDEAMRLVAHLYDDGARQAVHLILKKVKDRYHVTSAKVFSSHTLRKTFGRRVWLNECDRGRGDQALVLLCDVFGHANVATTKRYLGIRQEEILSVYDALNA